MPIPGRAIWAIAVIVAFNSAGSDDVEDRLNASKKARNEAAHHLHPSPPSHGERDAVIAAHKTAQAERLERTAAQHTEIEQMAKECESTGEAVPPDDQVAFCRSLCEFNDRVLDLYKQTLDTFDASKRLALVARSEGHALAREIHDRFRQVLGDGTIDGWRGRVLSLADTADGLRVEVEVCDIERGENPYLLVSEPDLAETRIGDGAVIAALREIGAGNDASISGKLVSSGSGFACPDPEKCLQKGTLGGFLSVRDGVPVEDGTAIVTGFRLLFVLEKAGP